jgi:hypothetical protein
MPSVSGKPILSMGARRSGSQPLARRIRGSSPNTAPGINPGFRSPGAPPGRGFTRPADAWSPIADGSAVALSMRRLVAARPLPGSSRNAQTAPTFLMVQPLGCQHERLGESDRRRLEHHQPRSVAFGIPDHYHRQRRVAPGFACRRASQPDCQRGNMDDPTLTHWLDITAFALPPVGSFGNAGNSTNREPGLGDWGFGVGKKFYMTEARNVEFRSEFFDFTNHPSFAPPGRSITTPSTFGLITSTVSSPRILEFVLKINF